VKARSMLVPVLSGGVLIGVMSALPFVKVCCCLWILGGGAIAAFLLQANDENPITLGDGALVGLFSGLLGAVIDLVVSISIHLVRGMDVQDELSQVTQFPNMPPEMVDAIARIGSSGFAAVLLMGIGFIMMLMLGAIFSTLGGLLGAFFFKKKVAPVPPPPTFTTGTGGAFPSEQ